jgi:hypothetical protein
MAIKVPTTQEQLDLAITIFNSKLNQTVPETDKAFVRVLSAVLASSHTSLYRYGINRALQNLALTATSPELETIGRNYGVTRKPAIPFVSECSALGVNGTNVPANTVWISDTTGLRYQTNTTVVVAGGTADMEITARTAGADSNMSVGETLTIDVQIVGLKFTATITTIVTLGTDEEDLEVYRRRVLNEIRTVGGGGNSVDYRTWAEQTSGVRRAYPYSGTPLAIIPTSLPGDRTVFIEATTEIDPDGIAPQTLLDDARDNINTNPETGKSRPTIGDTDATLHVESISRRTFYYQVLGLTIDSALEADAKADISAGLDLYSASLVPFLPGTDVISTKNDVITKMTIATVVQDILKSYGATATQVNFGLVFGTYTTETYTLAQGELAKSGGVVYA